MFMSTMFQTSLQIGFLYIESNIGNIWSSALEWAHWKCFQIDDLQTIQLNTKTCISLSQYIKIPIQLVNCSATVEVILQ